MTTLSYVLMFLCLCSLMCSLFSPKVQTVSVVSIKERPSRYQQTLQYPGGKFSPDIASVYGTKPVDAENILEDQGFSWLSEDISNGNPLSWSDRPNPGPNPLTLCKNLQKQALNECSCSDTTPTEVVFQGHTAPLKHETYNSRGTCTIVPFAGARASPDYCPTSFSTSTGCVYGV